MGVIPASAPQPMTSSPSFDSRSAAITVFLLALILYGSFYPFAFYSAHVSGLLLAFWATAHQPFDRGDFVSNILLYLPLGFFAVRCFPQFPAIARVPAVALAAALLATSIELAQFFDRGRAPSVFDVAANAMGATLGAAAGAVLRRITAPMLLLAAWMGARLLPYVPSLHFSKYEFALRSLFVNPQFSSLDVFRYFALWLAAALLAQTVFGERGRRVLILAILLVFAARIVLSDSLLAPSEVAGAAAAAILWISILSRLESRTVIVCAILVCFITLDALRPFHFENFRRPFEWVPFKSFMDGPRESGSRIFLEKTFIYGAFVWLLQRSGLSLTVAALSACALVFCLRLMQTSLPGRSAEITDPLMVLIFSGFLALLPD